LTSIQRNWNFNNDEPIGQNKNSEIYFVYLPKISLNKLKNDLIIKTIDMKISRLMLFIFSGILLFACRKERTITVSDETGTEVTDTAVITRSVIYPGEGKNFNSFVAFTGDSTQIKPVVLIIPEWWGLNDYAKYRAREIAKLGYFAMALDFYGDGTIAEIPEDAQKLATPFYENPVLGKQAFDAARRKLSEFPNADASKIAVIGYCFGGAQALNMARQEGDMKGAVSFHGNLMTGVKPNNNSVKILVMNGEADTFVSQEEIAAFKSEMDSAEIDYKFVNYPGAIHAFTNPEATEAGEKFGLKTAYNKEADEQSWEELKTFLASVFE